jgi:predicted phosphodiesterase
LNNKIRLVIPDSHGNHIDPQARAALLRDAKALDPDEVVLLGDHLDCGGIFNSHQRTYTNELCESYEDDCDAANSLLDELLNACPRATSWDYLEGNHEQHVERWAARAFTRRKDADALLAVYGPAKRLELKQRGIRYYKRSEHYQGLSIPGTIKRGKCFFTHGIVANKHATYTHLERFGACVVHGHTHRAQSFGGRLVSSDGIGAWSPGTLAKLQPLYLHTNPSGWSHGYHVQFVAKSGLFLAHNIPIMRGGKTLLREMVNTIHKRAA